MPQGFSSPLAMVSTLTLLSFAGGGAQVFSDVPQVELVFWAAPQADVNTSASAIRDPRTRWLWIDINRETLSNCLFMLCRHIWSL
jgi:hypothetical protein